MKINMIISSLLLSVFLGGCFQARNPFYTNTQIITDDRILGEYPDQKAGHVWSIKKNETVKKQYIATLRQGESWSEYSLTLFNLGGLTYIDIFPLEDSSMARDPGGPPTMSQIMKFLTSQPLHIVARIKIEENLITLIAPSREGLKNLFRQKPQLRKALNGGALQLSDTTEGLQDLLQEIGNNQSIFDYKAEMTKLK